MSVYVYKMQRLTNKNAMSLLVVKRNMTKLFFPWQL